MQGVSSILLSEPLTFLVHDDIDGWLQTRCNSIANTM